MYEEAFLLFSHLSLFDDSTDSSMHLYSPFLPSFSFSLKVSLFVMYL